MLKFVFFFVNVKFMFIFVYRKKRNINFKLGNYENYRTNINI